MEAFEKRVAALQAVEAALMERICRLQSATNNAERFEAGGTLQAQASKRVEQYSVEVRNLRRDYAQAVLNAYGVAVTTNGQILWS